MTASRTRSATRSARTVTGVLLPYLTALSIRF
jgi:hypothetical protein